MTAPLPEQVVIIRGQDALDVFLSLLQPAPLMLDGDCEFSRNEARFKLVSYEGKPTELIVIYQGDIERELLWVVQFCSGWQRSWTTVGDTRPKVFTSKRAAQESVLFAELSASDSKVRASPILRPTL